MASAAAVAATLLLCHAPAAIAGPGARDGLTADDALTVALGAVAHEVDPRFVSFVLDTASLPIGPAPGGVFPSYPYPIDLASPRLRGFAAALAPSLFVMNSGANNCIRYVGFDGDTDGKAVGNVDGDGNAGFESAYCKKKDYSGDLHPPMWDSLLNFTAAAGAGFVWHLNMVDSDRGYAPAYIPWDPSASQGLLRRAAEAPFGNPLAGALLFEEVRATKLGFEPTPGQIATDLALMRGALVAAAANVSGPGTPPPSVYGVLDQDSDQAPNFTDATYSASASAVDVVCFSYYQNNAAGDFCPVDPAATAAAILNATRRATLDTTARHFTALAARLGKPPPQLIAGAPCTHAPEGTGWGAVNAHAGLLWYADALGAAAAAGVAVFARQTIFGGSYGLLDNTTYMPTPGYWAAVLHTRLMGTKVLAASVSTAGPATATATANIAKHDTASARSRGTQGRDSRSGSSNNQSQSTTDAAAVVPDSLGVYAHCARNVSAGVVLLVANLAAGESSTSSRRSSSGVGVGVGGGVGVGVGIGGIGGGSSGSSGGDVALALPAHTRRTVWALSAPPLAGGLLARATELNGALLVAGGDGTLPALPGAPATGNSRAVDDNAPADWDGGGAEGAAAAAPSEAVVVFPAATATFVLLEGTAAGAAHCA